MESSFGVRSLQLSPRFLTANRLCCPCGCQELVAALIAGLGDLIPRDLSTRVAECLFSFITRCACSSGRGLRCASCHPAVRACWRGCDVLDCISSSPLRSRKQCSADFSYPLRCVCGRTQGGRPRVQLDPEGGRGAAGLQRRSGVPHCGVVVHLSASVRWVCTCVKRHQACCRLVALRPPPPILRSALCGDACECCLLRGV